MPLDFPAEYSQRTDDELLQLASARNSLTDEAVAALDAELRRRNLAESDRLEHQRFVKRQEQRETKRRRRKAFGTLRDRFALLDLLWGLLAMALISFTYLALPGRYHMKPDWQEASFYVALASVFIAVGSRSVFRRKSAFWTSLAVSSAIHLAVVHAWTQRTPNLSRGQAKAATLLGFLLFFAIYGLVSLLRRNFYGKEADAKS